MEFFIILWRLSQYSGGIGTNVIVDGTNYLGNYINEIIQKKSEIQVEVSELRFQRKSERRKDRLVRETINTIVGRLGLRMS